MRLKCPSCGAEYEIDAAAIPDEGREVQCSACGHDWFQYAPVTADFGAPVPFAGPPAPDPVRPPPLKDIRAFLREEAEEETRRRRAEGIPPPAPPPQPQVQPQPDVAAMTSSLLPEGGGKGGFGLGLFVTLTFFLLVAGVYVSAPRLSTALPELADPLAAYVAWVDAGRTWLDGFAGRIADALK